MPCAGCGITKSIINLYHGNLLQSLNYHLFGPFLILFCLFLLVKLPLEMYTKTEYFTKYIYNKKLAYGLASFLIIYHIIRIVIYLKNNNFNQIIQASVWG